MYLEQFDGESARCCPTCGWQTELLDDWASHMVNEHDVVVWQDDDGECYMDFPSPSARA